MEREAIIVNIKDILRKYLRFEYRIFLFGSWARGDPLDTSDIDVAILGKTKVPHKVMVKILREVENIPTLRSIDIVDLNATEKHFREHALRFAVPL